MVLMNQGSPLHKVLLLCINKRLKAIFLYGIQKLFHLNV